MNELVERAATAPSLRQMSTAELKAELGRALEVTAANLLHLARLWRELERRGEDMTQLRAGLRAFLPAIADGRLDAQAAVQFAGNLTMLRALGSQPLSVQRRLAAGRPVKVLTFVDGEWREEDRRCDDLSAAEIRQVFNAGAIRTVDEQRRIVGSAAPTRITKKSKGLRVRLTDQEAVDLEKKAAAEGLSVQAFAMARLFGPPQ